MSQNRARHYHDPVIGDFFEWINRSCAVGLVDPTRKEKSKFLPYQLLKEYFEANQYFNLKNILKKVFEDEREVPVAADEVARDYSRVFCILLLIGKGKYIHQFVRRDELRDTFLPFNARQAFPLDPEDENERDFLLRFRGQQWKFSAPIIDYHTTRTFDENLILPIMVTDRLKSGGSADVYQVVLHQNYNLLRSTRGSLPAGDDKYANTFILKTYYGRDAKMYFDNEVNAFFRLRIPPSTNMIGFYGGFIQGDRYNILLEYADKGSLDRYFKKSNPPTSGEDIIKFWEGLFGLLGALYRIHNVHDNSPLNPTQPLQGWHQDVKPGNILVTSLSETIQSPYEWKFKLADLGTSHFKSQVSSSDDTDKDSQGTRTYGAPECCRTDDVLRQSNIEVKSNVDVFSLGAVYSEAAVWLVENVEGVAEYRRDRRAATKKLASLDDGDCFHDGENMLEVVRQWHKRLQDRFRTFDVITLAVLGMIEDMLMDAASRANTTTFWRKSQNILRDARSALAEKQESKRSTTPKKPPPPPPASSRSSNSGSPTSTISEMISPCDVFSTPGKSSRPPNSVIQPSRTEPVPEAPYVPKLPVSVAIKWRDDKKKGLNPSLKGSYLFDRLRARDHMFIIDDTLSMTEHWNEMLPLFSILAYIVKEADPDGLDLFFTMESIKYHHKHTTKLVEVVQKRKQHAQGFSNISWRLDSILGDYKSRLKDQHGLRRGGSPWAPSKDVRPLNLYVFTDAAWQPKSDPGAGIKNLVDVLVQLKLEHAKQVGIQFISFGNNKAGLEKLQKLDDNLGVPDLKLDIVDTTPSNGNVWKMLLGAIDKDFDEARNETAGANAGPSTSTGLNDPR